MATFTADLFEESFSEEQHGSFLRCLTAIDKDTRWESVELRKTQFAPLKSVTQRQITGGKAVYVDTTLSPLPFVACLPDGRILAVRPYLWKNVKEHHGDNSMAVTRFVNSGRLNRALEHINFGVDSIPEKKRVLMCVRGNKISGWFSEFNASWGQRRQIECLESSLAAEFMHLSFFKAKVTHLYTYAEYKLDDSVFSKAFGSDSVLSHYREAWENSGLPLETIETGIPVLSFITGESGLTCITVRPMIYCKDGTSIPLGGELSVKHRGKDEAVWGKFETYTGQVASLYRNGLDAAEKLCNKRIMHPYYAFTHAAKAFLPTLPIKALRDAASSTELLYPRDDPSATCSAMQIVQLLSNLCNETKSTPIKKFNNIELIAQLYNANWGAMDITSAAHWVTKDVAEPDADDWTEL